MLEGWRERACALLDGEGLADGRADGYVVMDRARSALDIAAVVEQVAPGGLLLRSWALAGGISAAMTGLEIRLAGGRIERFVVRQFGHKSGQANRRAVADEYRLLQRLGEAGLAVPAVCGLELSGGKSGQPYLVLAYVEGEVTFAPDDMDAYLGHMAAQLAAIHGLDARALGLDFLPRQAQECVEIARWREVGSGPRAGGLHEAGLEIHRALVKHGPVKRRNPAALLHGDFWPGNVLWRAGRPSAVIDWEDAMIGEPLLDLAIARLDIGWIFGLPAMERFTGRYSALAAVDMTALPYWDLCAALRLVRLVGDDLASWAGFFEPFGRGDISEAGLQADLAAFAGRAMDGLSSE